MRSLRPTPPEIIGRSVCAVPAICHRPALMLVKASPRGATVASSSHVPNWRNDATGATGCEPVTLDAVVVGEGVAVGVECGCFGRPRPCANAAEGLASAHISSTPVNGRATRCIIAALRYD